MRSVITITFVALLAYSVLIGGCSAGGESRESASANPDNTTIVVPKADNSKNPYGSNSNSNVVPYNGTENLAGNPTLDNSKVTVVDTKNVKPTNPSKQLPDNSVLTTEMNSKGHVIETRTFDGDRAVKKIERITVTPEDVTIKVYLKNGKVKTLPDEKIRNFRVATVGEILEAAGEKLPVPSGAPVNSKDKTKKERGSAVSNR